MVCLKRMNVMDTFSVSLAAHALRLEDPDAFAATAGVTQKRLAQCPPAELLTSWAFSAEATDVVKTVEFIS
jgi:hypothetical protein